MTGHVRVGGATVPIAAAREFARRYLNSPAEPWSYPAYDRYPGGPTGLLSEQDLLAPVLLNVRYLSLESYYGLLGALPELNAILGRIPCDVPLESAPLPTLR